MRSRLWLLLHALVAIVPAMAALAHAPDVSLFGVEVPPALPALTVGGWWNEKLQPAFQGWFEASVGFRGVMIRTDNDLQATIAREKPGNTVVIGTDGVLFISDDVAFMGTRPAEVRSTVGRIDALTHALGSVHRKLTARGKHLAVVISPSKTAVYPEKVPARWRRSNGHRSDLEVNAALRGALAARGIPYTDGAAMLSGRTGTERDLVFPETGRHWSELGACLVLRDALRDGPARPSCAYEMRPTDRVLSPDLDLHRLLNVWRFEGAPPVHAALTETAPPGASRPRTVLVGTSFTWMLADVMRPLTEDPIAIFYNEYFYDASTPERRLLATVDPSSPEWTRYVLERDLYIVEILETYAQGEHLIKFVQTLDERLGPL